MSLSLVSKTLLPYSLTCLESSLSFLRNSIESLVSAVTYAADWLPYSMSLS